MERLDKAAIVIGANQPLEPTREGQLAIVATIAIPKIRILSDTTLILWIFFHKYHKNLPPQQTQTLTSIFYPSTNLLSATSPLSDLSPNHPPNICTPPVLTFRNYWIPILLSTTSTF
jgi:hypothetical protein